MLITEAQYSSLTPIGREIHEYWMKFKPKMYKEMHSAGTLWETLSSEDKRLFEMICDLMQNGLAEDQAKEIARAEIYDETEEADEELEETEQDRRAAETWELFKELNHLRDEANNLRSKDE
jgi:hypothetical protein